MENSIYLTFDFDWAPNSIIEELVDYLVANNVCASFFVTNDFPGLSKLKENELFDIGIHPNFTPLPHVQKYKSDFVSNCNSILEDLLEIVPDARMVRSHGLTYNTRVLNLFAEHGLKWESNLYVPHSSNLELQPFYYFNGLIRVPFYFEDDQYMGELRQGMYRECPWDVTPFFSRGGIKVFNFHPIHFKLNTEDMSRYYYYRNNNVLDVNGSDVCGARVFLSRVIEYAKAEGFSMQKLSSIKPESGGEHR